MPKRKREPQDGSELKLFAPNKNKPRRESAKHPKLEKPSPSKKSGMITRSRRAKLLDTMTTPKGLTADVYDSTALLSLKEDEPPTNANAKRGEASTVCRKLEQKLDEEAANNTEHLITTANTEGPDTKVRLVSITPSNSDPKYDSDSDNANAPEATTPLLMTPTSTP